MVERIRALLQARQLSPTQFADVIGVARPIVSHILSGRNKPSLEVVQKIIGAFPELSLAWLLSGTGPMLPVSEPEVSVRPATPAKAPERSAEAVEMPVKRPKATLASPVVQDDAAFPPFTAKSQPIAEPGPPMPVVESLVSPQPVPPVPAVAKPSIENEPVVSPAASILALAEPGKKIRRIVIFYHDGTFADYQPE